MMTTQELRTRVDNHACCIGGVDYTFKIHEATIDAVTGDAALEIHVIRHDGDEAVTAATVRVRGAVIKLADLPELLTRALQCWIAREESGTPTVH